MDFSDCGAASRYGESPVGDTSLEGRPSGRRQSPLWPFKPVGQAGLEASQFQASPWVVQVFRVVSKSVFPPGSLHFPPSPSPCLALGAGIQLAGATFCPPHSFKDPSGPGLAFPGTVVSGPRKGKPATLPESLVPRDRRPRSAQSPPESPGPEPQHQASLLGTVGHVAEP